MGTLNGNSRGRKIVLAASTSEATRYLAAHGDNAAGTLPAPTHAFLFYMIDVSWENEIRGRWSGVACAERPARHRVAAALKFGPRI